MKLNDIYIHLLVEASKKQIYEKYYSDVPQIIFDNIVATDPLYEKKPNRVGGYAKYLLSLYQKNPNSNFFNRLFSTEKSDRSDAATHFYNKVVKTFKDFDKLLKMGRLKEDNKKTDIYQYQNLNDLFKIVDEYRNPDGEILSKSEEIRRAKENSTVFFEDDETFIVQPHSIDASCYYGKNTKWCTAANLNNEFQSYYDQGDLYIIIDKINNEKYQLFIPDEKFETVEFRDAVENNLPLTKLRDINPDAYNAIYTLL